MRGVIECFGKYRAAGRQGPEQIACHALWRIAPAAVASEKKIGPLGPIILVFQNIQSLKSILR